MIDSKKHILVVDDEELNTKLFATLLTHLGYKVTNTTDSTEALRIFAENPNNFDLVLSDQTMPRLTGSELCIETLKIRPEIPFVIVTGTADINPTTLETLGVKEIIIKPVRLKAMEDTLKRHLN